MFEKIRLKKLSEHIWLMDESGEATGYIVVGSERAAVIDTMNGSENVKDVVRTVTDLPLTVINTHGHCDHIGGNVYFDEAYLHPADQPIVDEMLALPEVRSWLDECGLPIPPFRPVHDGDVFDLGGLTLEVIGLPEHTPGGILLLLPEERTLFTGDSINRHLWMQLDHSLSIEKLAEDLEKVMYLEMYADTILHGHAQGYEDISLMRKLLDGAKDILNGNIENDKLYENRYKCWNGTAYQHEFDENSVICYRKENIREEN